MTEFCPNAKATILAIAGKIDHLHIICTKQFFYKDTGAQSVLAVNVSSIREKGTYDGTCVLRAGDHPFITHDSYIRYKDAVVISSYLPLILAKLQLWKMCQMKFSDAFSLDLKNPNTRKQILRSYCVNFHKNNSNKLYRKNCAALRQTWILLSLSAGVGD